MRINTLAKYSNFVYLYVLLVLLVIFDLVVSQIDGSIGSGSWRLSTLSVIGVAFMIYRGLPVFIYDSDGEVLIITNKEPVLMKFSGSMYKHIELPKYKLQSFKISKWPLRRRLTIRISSKDKGVKSFKYSISYLNSKEALDLERSLRNTLTKNNSNK